MPLVKQNGYKISQSQFSQKLLSPELIERISGIDGAVLLDRDCKCHAIGVILDGMASQSGDPSRGARFNSAGALHIFGQSPITLFGCI